MTPHVAPACLDHGPLLLSYLVQSQKHGEADAEKVRDEQMQLFGRPFQEFILVRLPARRGAILKRCGQSPLSRKNEPFPYFEGVASASQRFVDGRGSRLIAAKKGLDAVRAPVTRARKMGVGTPWRREPGAESQS